MADQRVADIFATSIHILDPVSSHAPTSDAPSAQHSARPALTFPASTPTVQVVDPQCLDQFMAAFKQEVDKAVDKTTSTPTDQAVDKIANKSWSRRSERQGASDKTRQTECASGKQSVPAIANIARLLPDWCSLY